MADEGLRFEAWSMPHVGALTRKFDFTKWVESYTLNDRFNDLCDGRLTIPDDAQLTSGVFLKDRLLYIDEANHANDVGSMIRILRGTTPIMHFITTRLEDEWSDTEPTTKVVFEGLEWILDRALVPNYDHPADPTVDPDWIYGADTILKNAGLEESGQSLEIQLLWLTGATGGTFTITYSAQTTAAIAWNADWFAVGNALEALSNIQDVTVSGAGTATSPWTVEFIDPSGDVAAMTMNTGSTTGPAPLGHVETTLPGGQNDTSGWTTSFNPETGEPHGTYQNFQVSTAQVHSGTYSLLVNAAAPTNPSDFPGAQQILNVTPGRTYRAEVWIYPTFSATFRLVIRTMDETWIAESSGSGTPLTANTWTKLTIAPFVMPAWVDQVIFRVGLIDSTDRGEWYIDDAVLAPGFPAATLGTMMSDIRTAALALGSPLAWLTPTWSTTLDSDGVAWDQNRQWNVNHGQSFLQLFEICRKWNYEFRIRWDVGDNRFEWDMWNPSAGGQTRANIAITGKSGVEGA